MSIGAQGIQSSGSLRSRIPLLISPLAALIYPFTLMSFNTSVIAIDKLSAGGLPWLTAAISLLVAFAVPMLSLLQAMSLAEIQQPTLAELRAKRVALLAVSAPTLFTFIGVLLYMLHDPVPDTWLWGAFWLSVLVMLLRGDSETPAPTIARPVPATLRVAHAGSALAIIGMFLVFHLTNHLTGLLGPSTYDAMMKTFRHVYRTELSQPALVALFFFQIGTGLFFVWRGSRAPSDRFRSFQMASGVYLAFYVLGHMDSVFIFARTYLGVDTGWGFATGAPTGLIKDSWNIRLVPHYWLGVFFVLSHLAAGAREVMISHGIARFVADRFMIGVSISAALVATAIMLGMCGVRV
jgi:hypothetical protein